MLTSNHSLPWLPLGADHHPELLHFWTLTQLLRYKMQIDIILVNRNGATTQSAEPGKRKAELLLEALILLSLQLTPLLLFHSTGITFHLSEECAWEVGLPALLNCFLFLTPVTSAVNSFQLSRNSLHVDLCRGFPGSSAGKEFAGKAGDMGSTPGLGRSLWRRAWQPTPVFLAGESPWTEEPGGLQFMGSQRVGHDWATKHSTAIRWLLPRAWWNSVDFSHKCSILSLSLSLQMYHQRL